MNKKRKKVNIVNFSVLFLMLIALAVITGCSQQGQEKVTKIYPIRVSPKLILYSPGELPVDPQMFAERSDWPYAFGGIELGESTYYREHWYDRQTTYPNSNDHSYKLFHGYRTGQTIR